MDADQDCQCHNIQGLSPRIMGIYPCANDSSTVLIAVNSVHEWKSTEILFHRTSDHRGPSSVITPVLSGLRC